MVELLVYDNTIAMPPELEQQVVALLREEGFLDGPFDGLDPSLRPVYFLLVEDGRVLSYGRTIRAVVDQVDNRLTVYGLGDLVTRPDVRRKGYGSQITEAATAHILKQDDADLAVLLTDPAMELFYARHGWRHAPGVIRDPKGYPMARFARTLLLTRPLDLPGDEW
jgi:predicted N-acetyltransferase YhbS